MSFGAKDMVRINKPGEHRGKSAIVVRHLGNSVYKVRLRNGREEDIHNRWLTAI